MSDKPTGAYDTGGSGFDATRDADNPVAETHAVAPVAPVKIAVTTAKSTVSQSAWDHAVGEWIDLHIRSSPIAQGTHGAWEHLLDSLPKLKELLERELKT